MPPLRQAGFFLWPSLKSDKIEKSEELLLKEIKPSGMIFFRRNLTSLAKAKLLIAQVKKICDNSLEACPMEFIAGIDEEGGLVSRLPLPFPRGKTAEEWAQSGDLSGLMDQVLHQIFVSKGLGINCLFAPVVDILTEPSNPVMKTRCFGTTAQQVIPFATQVHRTLQSEGIYSCAKHFPGHGNTTTDSHKESSQSQATLDVLQSREWLPFQALIGEKIPLIMAAHVFLPQVSGDTPASLNPLILKDHLRSKLGFQGLILSDDLRMNAIEHYYRAKGIGENYLEHAAIDALQAGCDILLSCHSVEQEFSLVQSIAKKLSVDPLFFELLKEKAWHIYQMFSKSN